LGILTLYHMELLGSADLLSYAANYWMENKTLDRPLGRGPVFMLQSEFLNLTIA